MASFLIFRPACWRAFVIFGSFLLLLRGARAAGPGEFTPWMPLSGLNEFLEGLSGHEQGAKNFFDRGNWLTAVEGRWEDGIPQYRVSHGPVPAARRAVWWQWFINQDKQSFDGHVHRLADEGFKLVHFNSYVRPGGGERFQGVWHKLIPLTNAPLLPEGVYRLSEMEGKPVTDWQVSLVIEGDRLTARCANYEYKGSVRDRYSGSITVTKLVEQLTYSSQQAPNLERAFPKVLENAAWKEEGGKIRAVKNGYTVLRFDREDSKAESPKPAQ